MNKLFAIYLDLDSGFEIEDSAYVESSESVEEALRLASQVVLTGSPASEVITRYVVNNKQVTYQEFIQA